MSEKQWDLQQCGTRSIACKQHDTFSISIISLVDNFTLKALWNSPGFLYFVAQLFYFYSFETHLQFLAWYLGHAIHRQCRTFSDSAFFVGTCFVPIFLLLVTKNPDVVEDVGRSLLRVEKVQWCAACVQKKNGVELKHWKFLVS